MATGFDIDEEDYNWWVDISEYADLDPTTIREITTSG